MAPRGNRNDPRLLDEFGKPIQAKSLAERSKLRRYGFWAIVFFGVLGLVAWVLESHPTLDSFLRWVVVMSPTLLSVGGVALSLRKPDDRYHNKWRWAAIVIGVSLTIATLWQQSRLDEKHSQEIKVIVESNQKVVDGLRDLDVQRKADNAVLVARLDDASKANDDLRRFAPAIMRLAEATSENTRKQYESKVITDGQVKDMAIGVIKRIRDLHEKCENEKSAIFRPFAQADNNLSPDARRAAFIDEQNRQLIERLKIDDNCHTTFTNLIMSDAQYVQRELIKKTNGDGFIDPRLRFGRLVILYGTTSGPDPYLEGASYLDALLRKVLP
jgi:hypothetical protein